MQSTRNVLSILRIVCFSSDKPLLPSVLALCCLHPGPDPWTPLACSRVSVPCLLCEYSCLAGDRNSAIFPHFALHTPHLCLLSRCFCCQARIAGPAFFWFPVSPRLPLVQACQSLALLSGGSCQILLQGGHCCLFAVRNPGLHPAPCFLDRSFSYWATVADQAFA
jgi:hypothetical protein